MIKRIRKIEPYLLNIMQSSKDFDKISRVLNLVSKIALDESTLHLFMSEKIIFQKKTIVQKYADLISRHCIFYKMIPDIIRYSIHEGDYSVSSLSRITIILSVFLIVLEVINNTFASSSGVAPLSTLFP